MEPRGRWDGINDTLVRRKLPRSSIRLPIRLTRSPGSVTLQSFLLDVEWSTCDMAIPPGNGEAGELTFVTVPTDRRVGSRGTFFIVGRAQKVGRSVG